MRPALAEELAEKTLRALEENPQDRNWQKLYLLGLFIQLVHPLQGHDDAGLRDPYTTAVERKGSEST